MGWRKVLALMLGAGGVIFFAQGSGLSTAYPSVMNNDIRWAVVGIGLVIVAVFLWPRGEKQK
jgi:drug/metabolite transporter (DMT)-like permease